jgi:acyl-CoA thioesterase-1
MKAVGPRRLNRVCAALAAFAAGAISCGGDSPVKPSAERPSTPVVVAFGDSLTAGPGLRPEETWPALLQQRARAAGYPHRFVNAGVSGDTTSDAVRRLDSAFVPDTLVFIVALGANDGLRGVPIATVRGNLETIVERAQARDLRVLLCGMETPPARGWEYSVEFHRLFPDLAARYDVPLMPFLLFGVLGNPYYNLGDRVHPNAGGMRVIADTMWPYVEPLLE